MPLEPECCAAFSGDCLIGDVDNNGMVTITDALEILKFLAGLENLIEGDDPIALRHSLTLESSVEANKPAILDVLEVLKALARLPNTTVTRLSR